MIYTSYFARLKDIPEKYIPVSIARYSPKFYTGLEYKRLAPSSALLKVWKETYEGVNDTEKYKEIYQIETLQKLSVQQVLQDLLSLTGSYDIVLICYEKSDAFCHRHLVSQWLRSSGVKCEEYKF